MTNRRSLQTNMQRISRAQQFVPGHVGGRVASAQPVRERRKVGAASQRAAEPPTGAIVRSGYTANGGTISFNAFDTGTTSALLWVASKETTSLPATPAGWTSLLSGVQGDPEWGDVAWRLAAIDNVVGTENRAVTCAAAGIAIYTYFTGGTPGHWSATLGPSYDLITLASYAEPPAGAQVWQQFGWMGNWYSTFVYPSGLGVQNNAAPYLAEYCYPDFGTYTGAGFTAAFSGTPFNEADDGLIDWSGLGAYRYFGSQAVAAGWTG